MTVYGTLHCKILRETRKTKKQPPIDTASNNSFDDEVEVKNFQYHH
jgi:hypothetical protein